MPDYGDDRGFGMNVPQRVVRPDTGFDRAGPAIPDRANMRDVAQGPGGFDPNLRRAGYENLINQNRNMMSGMDYAGAGAGAGAAVGFGLGTKQPHTKAYESLWKLANRNVISKVGASAANANNQNLILREWDKLKKMYDAKVAGGGASGTIGQKIKNVGRLAGKYGKFGALGVLGMAPEWWNIMTGEGGEIAPEFATQQGSQFSFSRGGIASLIRRRL